MSQMPPPPPPPGQGFPPPMPQAAPPGNYANWIQRVLAYIIDILPAGILSGIGFLLSRPDTTTTVTDNGVSIQTTSGLGFTYWAFWGLGVLWLIYNKGYLEGKTTQSIGKRALGMHTVGQDTGQALGFGMALLRFFLLYFDFLICYVGVLWPIWDKDRQCLISDKATRAIVNKS